MYQGAYVYKQIETLNLAKNSFVEGIEQTNHSQFFEESNKN